MPRPKGNRTNEISKKEPTATITASQNCNNYNYKNNTWQQQKTENTMSTVSSLLKFKSKANLVAECER